MIVRIQCVNIKLVHDNSNCTSVLNSMWVEPSFFGQQTRPFYLMNGQRKLLLVSGWKRQSEQGTATTLKTNAHNKCAMSPISAKATMPTEKTIKTIDIPKTLSWKWSIKFSFNTISSKCTKIKNETIKSHQMQLKKFIWKFLV